MIITIAIGDEIILIDSANSRTADCDRYLDTVLTSRPLLAHITICNIFVGWGCHFFHTNISTNNKKKKRERKKKETEPS